MSDIDFESNKFEPVQWRLSNGNNNKLENFQLNNFNRSRAFGWLHNATAYYGNLVPNPAGYIPSDDDYWPTINYNFSGKKYKIRKLDAGELYQVNLYRPQNNSLYFTYMKRSTIFGYIRYSCLDMFNYRNDYTWKAYTIGNSFRISEHEIDIDTLDCDEDTIWAEAKYPNDSLFLLSYVWNIDGVQFFGPEPIIPITTFGIHNAELYVSDQTGWTDTLKQIVVKLECNEEQIYKLSRNPDTLETIIIYPNPTNKIIFITFPNQVQYSIIEIYNYLGEQVYSISLYNISQFSIDVSQFPSGTYLCRIMSDEIVVVNKILIQK